MPGVIHGSAGQTLYFKFTSRDSTGLPTALSSGTISVYKDASTTESTSGVTLTASFDSVVGLNHVAINTAADGTFYANGSHFDLVLTAGTVGGVSVVGEVVGSFDLAATFANAVWDEVLTGATHNVNNSAGKILRVLSGNTDAIYSGTCPSQVGMTTTQIKLDSGASAVDDTYNFTVISIVGGTGVGQSRIITDYVGSTKVCAVDSAWTTPPNATSQFEITPTASTRVVSYLTGQDPASYILTTPTNTLATTAAGEVTAILADGVAHGGTPGSSTATFSCAKFQCVNGVDGDAAFVVIGQGGGDAMYLEGSHAGAITGASHALRLVGGNASTTLSSATALAIYGGEGAVTTNGASGAIEIYPGFDNGAGAPAAAVLIDTGGGASTTDGIRVIASGNGNGFSGIGAGTGAGFSSVPDAVGFGTGGVEGPVEATLDLTQVIPTSNTAGTLGDALNAALVQGFGDWVLDVGTTTLTLKRAGGATVHSFQLNSASAPTTRTSI